MIDLYLRLARGWLKLPEGNPSIPAGDPTKVKTWNPADGYLSYKLLGFWIAGIPSLLTSLACFVGAGIVPALMVRDGEIPEGAAPLVAVGMVLFGLFLMAVMALNYATVRLELDMLRYTLTDRALRLRRGVMSVEEVTISYANIQDVKFSQGPLQRYFGIADLIVETAGGGGGMPQQQGAAASLHHRGLIKGVGDPEALREVIRERMKKARGGGLGDAVERKRKPVATKPTGLGVLDGPRGRALLAEIRDGLAAIRASE